MEMPLAYEQVEDAQLDTDADCPEEKDEGGHSGHCVACYHGWEVACNLIRLYQEVYINRK